MSIPRHLVIFTRWPRYGAGKRRLAAEIGAIEALRFQRTALSLMLRRLGADPRWTTWLAVTPDRSGPWPAGLGILPQGQGNLGQRMARVARLPPPGPVLIIGSDIPGITREMVAHGFRALGDHAAVFGPATDGGYWAVGLRRRPRFVAPFDDVRWSTEHALADSLANLTGSSVALLDMLEDVDDARSFIRLRQRGLLDAHFARR
jgi:rSAM/selenodomain-associated transferase 1